MKRILFPILLLLSLTACSLAPDSYLSVTPHAGTTGQADPADAVEASDYSSLKRAILGFVEAGQTQGTILAASYDGDLERDLTDVAYEITKLNPLGAYAVDYMTHDSTFIVNYYQISIQITFRRTAREIALQCGYQNETHFSRQCKQQTGCSPLAYRGSGTGG